ncbi:hypothetical protein HDU67_000179 [Dinochytrium kinnereticum]|nr:hypothetical protein HDU67_000179 [Dinochytrium kinnereticum]
MDLDRTNTHQGLDDVGEIGDLIFSQAYDSDNNDASLFNKMATDDHYFFSDRHSFSDDTVSGMLPNALDITKTLPYIPNTSRPLKRESTMDSTDLEMATVCGDSDGSGMLESPVPTSTIYPIHGIQASASAGNRRFTVYRGKNHKRRMSETCLQTTIPVEGYIKADGGSFNDDCKEINLASLWGAPEGNESDISGFLSGGKSCGGPIHISRSLNDLQGLTAVDLFDHDMGQMFDFGLLKSIQKSADGTEDASTTGLKNLSAGNSWLPTAPTLLLTGSQGSMHDVAIPGDEQTESFLEALGATDEDCKETQKKAAHSKALFTQEFHSSGEGDINDLLENLAEFPTTSATASPSSATSSPDRFKANELLTAFAMGSNSSDSAADHLSIQMSISSIDSFSAFCGTSSQNQFLSQLNSKSISMPAAPVPIMVPNTFKEDTNQQSSLLSRIHAQHPSAPINGFNNPSYHFASPPQSQSASHLPLGNKFALGFRLEGESSHFSPVAGQDSDSSKHQGLAVPSLNYFCGDGSQLAQGGMDSLAPHVQTKSSPTTVTSSSSTANTPPASPTKRSPGRPVGMMSVPGCAAPNNAIIIRNEPQHTLLNSSMIQQRGSQNAPIYSSSLPQTPHQQQVVSMIMQPQPHFSYSNNTSLSYQPLGRHGSSVVNRTPSPSPPTLTSTPSSLSIPFPYQQQHMKHYPISPISPFKPQSTIPTAKRNWKSKESPKPSIVTPQSVGSTTPSLKPSKRPCDKKIGSVSSRKSSSASSTPGCFPRAIVGMDELIKQNNSLRAQVAAAKAIREREEAESGQMLETLNRLMGMGIYRGVAKPDH